MTSPKVHTTLTNYLNGNITTAKHHARRVKPLDLLASLVHDYGYTPEKALLTTRHLKGEDCWQAACDQD